MTPKIDPQVMERIRDVESVVSPVYLVGGSVRDVFLGKAPKDYDFTTPLSPDQIEAAVEAHGRRAYTIGKKFGTIGFKSGDQFVEVTTFRTEEYVHGSRKPTVSFIDNITHDLSRRDFTINAMALRSDGTVIDPFGGQADLAAKLIRTVNKPYDRYNEDPLRMLRAARFHAELGFTIEEEAKHQAAKKAEHILTISKERWTLELDKLLGSDNPVLGLRFLAETRLLNFILPELAIQVGFNQHSPYHQLDLWEHTLKTVSLTTRDVSLRWAALLHDIGKPYVQTQNTKGYSNYAYHELVGAEMIQKIGSYLRWSNKRTETIDSLVRHHLEDHSPIGEADSDARYTG